MVVSSHQKTIYIRRMDISPIATWHKVVEQKDFELLESLIDQHCVFYSPIVFKPQEGKRLTSMYLSAAFEMFKEANSFNYVKEIAENQMAVLEFESEIDGIVINGIDMITWNDKGLITEFKVMIRPYKALNMINDQMTAMLDKLKQQASA